MDNVFVFVNDGVKKWDNCIVIKGSFELIMPETVELDLADVLTFIMVDPPWFVFGVGNIQCGISIVEAVCPLGGGNGH